MEPKKSVEADLEWRKPLFILIGLAVALVIVYFAIEKVGSRDKADIVYAGSAQIVDAETVIQTEQPKETPPPPPQQMLQTLIEVVSNTISVEDFHVDVESDQRMATEEIVYVEDTKVEEVKEAEIFVFVEENPEYPGGEEARIKFLKDNIEYPRIARDAGLEGKVWVGFVVEADGRITNVKILRGRAQSLDDEALRVAKLMPKWKPGKQRTKAVRVQYQMPITFTLN
jgi:protein TonB